jgi:hypothetical protein
MTLPCRQPEITFEGPQGFHFDPKDAPIESLARGLVEILREAEKRGFTLAQLVAMGERR